MRPIKMFGLAALAALMAMAFVGASSAMALGPTALCKEMEDPCAPANIITQVHEESLGHALLLSFVTVECATLFSGTVQNGGLSPLSTDHVNYVRLDIKGHFFYTCLNGCTATEEGEALIRVLKLGHELADVTGEALVHVVCGLNCRYNGVGLEAHALGPLLSTMTNGSVTLEEQETNKESGTFCPATAELDITTEPLIPTYIST